MRGIAIVWLSILARLRKTPRVYTLHLSAMNGQLAETRRYLTRRRALRALDTLSRAGWHVRFTC